MTGSAMARTLLVASLAFGGGPGGARAGSRVGRVDRIGHQPSPMVTVPAGTFFMGFGDGERDDASRACRAEFGTALAAFVCLDRDQQLQLFADAIPARDVFVGGFDIDRYEVTVKQYRACVATGACDVGALLLADDRYLEDLWPMVNVAWQDAVDYCRWQGKRLPTEAEWEKAARGTDGRRWPWGNQPRVDGANHGRVEADAMLLTHGYVTTLQNVPALEYVPDDSDGALHAAPPGQLRWAESPYGAYDLAGNVAEWVYDYYWDGDLAGDGQGGYADLPDVNPIRIAPRGVRDRVVRGGSWIEPAIFARTYARGHADASDRSASRGFRCARDAQ
jgi:formylglycine-generating enzyme required for sulfatase activity